MRQLPLSLFGSTVPVLVCAAFCLPSARAQTSPYPNAPAASAAKPAAQNEASKVFVLRYIKPSRFIEQIAPAAGKEEQATRFLLLPGITRLSPDDATKRLVMRGTPDAVSRMDEIVRLFDVEPRRVHITARILRVPALKGLPTAPPFANVSLDDKLPKSEVLTTITSAFSNNETLTLSAVGDGQFFSVQLTPHVNGDESVSVTASFSPLPTTNKPLTFEEASASRKENAGQAARTYSKRGVNGTPIYLLYTPSFQNKEQAFYLEVTPFVQPRQEQP